MEVIGKIIADLGETSGTSKAGRAWKKHNYVLETQESYPKKIAFDFFGERADQYPLTIGQNIKLSFDIDSHEYNGRWFTSISGWKAEPAEVATPTPTGNDPFGPQAQQYNPVNIAPEPTVNDDLPF